MAMISMVAAAVHLAKQLRTSIVGL